MSMLTDFLKLFKYEAEDETSTFNIETALNENWNKIDAEAKKVNEEMNKKVSKGCTWGDLKGDI